MLTKLSVAIALAAFASGIAGLATTSEYVRVVVNQGKEAIQDNIPADVEIDRLGLILSKLDEELADSRRIRAESAIRLEKASRQLEDKREELDDQRKEVEACKSRLTDANTQDEGCSSAKATELANWTKSCLSRFKATQKAVENLEQTVINLKKVQSELADLLNTRRQQRDELAARLDAIRIEKESLDLLTGGSGNLPSSDNLRRADELAEKLEDKLRVEREIVPTQDDVWSETAARGEAAAPSSQSLLDEIDQTLKSKDDQSGAE
jgi:DNA repair exonuclease SbcCD ATPase subunit